MKKLSRTFGALWLVGALGITQLAIVTPAHAAPTCFGKRATLVAADRPGQRLVGTPANDVIVGSGYNDVIIGRGGNDRICGRDGTDKLRGDGGHDRVHAGNEYCEEQYYEIVEGNVGRDLVIGSQCTDKIYGGKGADEVRGNGSVLGRDFIFGGTGDDDLAYAPRDPECQCNDGAVFTPGPGTDQISGDGGSTLSYAPSATGVEVDVPAGTATGEGTDTFTEILAVIGSAQADVLIADVGSSLSAGGGNDRLVGSEGSEGLQGGPGDDDISGAGGNDGLSGGLGDDLIDGGEGIDVLSFYEPDRPVHVDLALGEATGHGHDTIQGIENLIGGEKDDVLLGDDGPNEIQDCCRAKSADTINGRGGNDVLHSDWGPDTVNGGSGDDSIFGDYGDDTLDGGDGIDEIDGSNGTDTCTNGEVVTNCEP